MIRLPHALPTPAGWLTAIAGLTLALPMPASAQTHDHDPVAEGASADLAGQAAFGAIAAIVAQLEADPATDWNRVDIEALRQHLLDMDRVMMQAVVETKELPAGARFVVTGSGPAIGSIQRMTIAHARALESGGRFAATATPTERGAILEVTAPDGSTESIAKIRGLGFAGILTIDDHHGRHHRMLASGAAPPGH